MTQFNVTAFRATLSLAAVLATGPLSHAASSLTNSLKGFTGNSTEVATQTALGAAGFDFFSLEGLSPDFDSDPAVTFDAAGAHFGLDFALAGGGGDGGRNYMRTIESDYATVSFVAEITMDLDMGAGANQFQQAFFGMGAGETAYFGVPDWSTQFFSSTFVTPERGLLKTWSSANDVNVWNDNDPVPTLTGMGTHRLRMTYDGTAHTVDIRHRLKLCRRSVHGGLHGAVARSEYGQLSRGLRRRHRSQPLRSRRRMASWSRRKSISAATTG